MSNVSLARIMFGTNDDLHSQDSLRAWAGSSYPGVLRSSASPADETAATTSRLTQLLHKAWAALHAK